MQSWATLSLWPALIWLGLTLSSANMSSLSVQALHTCRWLNTFHNISVTLGVSPILTHVPRENQMGCGDGWTQFGPATLKLFAHKLAASSWWTTNLSLGRVAARKRLFVYFRSRIRCRKPSRAKGPLSSWDPQGFWLPTKHHHWNLWRQSGMCTYEWKPNVPQSFAPHQHMPLFCARSSRAGFVKLIPLRTHEMVADALTKRLPSPAFIVMICQTRFTLQVLQC